MDSSKRFFRYVSQNIFGMLGVSCYIIADTFFISVAAGSNGITVLNLTLPIYNLIFAIGSMLGLGTGTRFSILRAQNDKRADEYLFHTSAFALLFSTIFVLVGIFSPDGILRLMGADAEIAMLGKGYTRIFLLFTPCFMFNYIIGSMVRNDNDPGRAMVGTVASSLFNIVFDYILMFPMKMGLEGAALATAISPIVSIVICGTHFFGKNNTIRLVPVRLGVKKLFDVCRLGVSGFIGEFASAVTTTTFNYLILGIAGNIGVAAYGVVANFALVATAIFNGVAQGAQPLVSEAYGLGDKREQKKLLRLGLGTLLVIACILYAAVFLLTDQMIAAFNRENSETLALYAFEGVRLYFAGFFFAGINIVGIGFLGASDRPRASFGLSMCRGVVMILAFSFLLSDLFGMTGIWLSFAAAEGFTAIFTIILLLRGCQSRFHTFGEV